MVAAFNVNNVHLAPAPPSYFVPNVNGAPVQAGLSSWRLSIDLGGAIPPGQTLSIGIEFQRDAWTDPSGAQHPAGEWLQDSGGDLTTGPYTGKNGLQTTVNFIASSIGGGSAPYPNRVRVRVDQSGDWVSPNVTLDLI